MVVLEKKILITKNEKIYILVTVYKDPILKIFAKLLYACSYLSGKDQAH